MCLPLSGSNNAPRINTKGKIKMFTEAFKKICVLRRKTAVPGDFSLVPWRLHRGCWAIVSKDLFMQKQTDVRARQLDLET